MRAAGSWGDAWGTAGEKLCSLTVCRQGRDPGGLAAEAHLFSQSGEYQKQLVHFK